MAVDISQIPIELTPTSAERSLIKETLEHLKRLTVSEKGTTYYFRLESSDDNEAEVVDMDPAVISLMVEILQTLSEESSEVTTQEAADYLNVSRPFLVKLLEEGQIPFRKVGTHRRIRIDDLKGYKQSIDREREAVLKELARQAQELNLGY